MNKMPLENLAKVLGPTVVGYSTQTVGMQAALEETVKQESVIHTPFFKNGTRDTVVGMSISGNEGPPEHAQCLLGSVPYLRGRTAPDWIRQRRPAHP